MSTMEHNAAELPDRDDSTSITPASDPLSDFLARSMKRREIQASDPERLSSSWFELDPEVIRTIPKRSHPVTALYDQSRAKSRSLKSRRHTTRSVLALLTEVPVREVTWDDVMSYPWHHVGPDEARAYLRAVNARYVNIKTRHYHVAHLRSVLKRCADAKLISLQRLAEIRECLPVAGNPGVALNGRRLTSDEISRLMASAQQSTDIIAARDTAMLSLFLTTGMRISELCDLDLADWHRTDEILTIRLTKNGSDRMAVLDPRATRYLLAWLVFRGEDAGPLFTSSRKEGCEPGQLPRLSVSGIRERIMAIAKRAGIGHLKPHDFRRTVASTLLRTVDAPLVGRILGHRNLASTLMYDLATDDEQRGAIGSLPLPDLSMDDEREDDAS